MKVCTVDQMHALDRSAMEDYGIPQEILMENAGQALYFAILREMSLPGNRFVVFSGGGNNGGDGLVVARKLFSNGADVTVLFLGKGDKLKGAAKLNYEMVQQMQLPLLAYEEAEAVPAMLRQADAVIDAMFGTGLDREVGGAYRQAIAQINAAGKPVFSVDIPSGINGNTGAVMGTAVQADYTVTFGLPKLGSLLYPGFAYGGKLFVTHISFPPALYGQDSLAAATNDPLPLAPRQPDSHKGDFGKVLFIAGSSNYLGAPYFSSYSFLKGGGGLAFLATPEGVSDFIGNKGSELIFYPQKPTGAGSIALENKQQLLDAAAQMDFAVLGPGLSLNEETQQLSRALAEELQKPLLIDGDGITAIAGRSDLLEKRTQPVVLTPHPGEMARLAGVPVKEVLRDKVQVLRKTAASYKAVIVLKGAHSLIGTPEGQVFVNLSGNAGMGTAGSGDVLTGCIAAMHGLGLSFTDAVRTGVFIHGYAGDLAAAEKGEDGLMAGDIMAQIPQALKKYRTAYKAITADYYQRIHVI